MGWGSLAAAGTAWPQLWSKSVAANELSDGLHKMSNLSHWCKMCDTWILLIICNTYFGAIICGNERKAAVSARFAQALVQENSDVKTNRIYGGMKTR